ncbi:sigma-70 family RNA polymerase sigma factor [Streptomyces sp. SKN60]|uniref:sigma-70 family RNA polymerase sigma factor n=1 Tax=Streptomyces sp. SKN60 TaxID=2855506 RepID=UPI0022486503|nr:sigma-70 family RNA polymerase sigma factor [Streptomyces sp. SKN60]MCX2185770.1 sigma-70 family RNA polymerase sigma factor [Streptomyces sp. SKN60]
MSVKDLGVNQPQGSDSGVSAMAAEQLLEAVYREYGPALLRFLVGQCGGDRQQAEDIMQEVMARAWKHADKLATMEAAGVRPWLVTVARRLVIDAHRARQARPAESGPEPLDLVAGPDEVARTMATMVVSEALDTLSEIHRQALMETYLEGRTVAQAAAHLGIAAGTMKSRIYYALHAMRLALQESDERKAAWS